MTAPSDEPLPEPSNVAEPRELKELGPTVHVGRVVHSTDVFMHSKGSVRDDYKSQNLGSRNSRVREVGYDEAMQERDEAVLQKEAWLCETRLLIEQADAIVSDAPPQHAAAMRALQDALISMVGATDNEGDEGGLAGGACQPCAVAIYQWTVVIVQLTVVIVQLIVPIVQLTVPIFQLTSIENSEPSIKTLTH